MKVLLIQPPIEDFYTTPIRLYPLGLLYAAAVLKQLGCSVKILDCLNPIKKRQIKIPDYFQYLVPLFAEYPFMFKAYYRFGLSENIILSEISSFQPDWIGISSQFTAYFKNVYDLVIAIKSHLKIPVFIGGNHATAFASAIKNKYPEIDYVLKGPAEDSLPRFLDKISDKNSHTINWKEIKPIHELLDSENYKIGKKNYISIIASRGCPFKCEFCSVYNMFGRRIDYRPVFSVIQEMEDAYLNRNVKIFNFEDDNLTVNKNWMIKFLNNIIKHPFLKNVELTAMNGLCYTTLNETLLQKMFDAGFRKLDLSFVTQDKKLRKELNRPDSKDELQIIVKAAKKLGFFITIYIILGLPNQTINEIKKTVEYLLDLGVLVGPSVFYIPPASDLYNKMHIPTDIRQNWNFFRSSAFAIETPYLNREQLVSLFSYIREKNILNKNTQETHHASCH